MVEVSAPPSLDQALPMEAADSPYRRARKAFEWGAPYAIILPLLIAWGLAAHLNLIMPFLLPSPFAVARWMINDLLNGNLVYNVSITLYRTMMGFALAALSGVAIGILMSRLATVRWFFDPILSIMLPMPKIALLPVFMLWFGLYDSSKISIVAFSVCFQIIISTYAATQGVEKELVWSARSLGANEREVLREILLPAALPQILTALQIAAPVCLIIVVVTEMVMGGRGLGDSMLVSARYAKTAGVFAGIIEVGLLGFGVIKGMDFVRRRLLKWHQEVMRQGDAH
jgi:ABC-type nitrate/sulfonate/bicarbonate transport system permease component